MYTPKETFLLGWEVNKRLWWSCKCNDPWTSRN